MIIYSFSLEVGDIHVFAEYVDSLVLIYFFVVIWFFIVDELCHAVLVVAGFLRVWQYHADSREDEEHEREAQNAVGDLSEEDRLL